MSETRMQTLWAEPFAGAAAVALRLVGGRTLTPPVSWMGGKRRLARDIADVMGVPSGRPSRVLLADAGPWGWVWPLLLEPRTSAQVCRWLRRWSSEHPRDLWDRLADQPPAEDAHERAAQWLWLQARSASGVPIWHSTWAGGDHGQQARQKGGDWVFGSRPDRHVPARKAGQFGLPSYPSDGPQKGGGMVNPATIAERIEAIGAAFAAVDYEVHAGDVRELEPCPGFCFLDPPYVGCTGYGWVCPRDKVLELARRWRDAGAVVAVSEAEPLELEGWHHVELTLPGGKPEWITVSRPPARLPERLRQGRLFA